MLDPGSLIYFFGLPMVGTFIACVLGLQAHYNESKKVLNEPDASLRIRVNRTKLSIMMMLTFTTIAFGFAGFFLSSKTTNEIDHQIISAVGINIGVAGLFCALGEGILMRSAVKDMVKRPENFGKHLVAMMSCEISLIFAFAIMFLSLKSTSSIESIVNANYIMALASVGGLVSGILPAKTDPSRFSRRILLGDVGVVIAIVGFIVAFGLVANMI